MVGGWGLDNQQEKDILKKVPGYFQYALILFVSFQKRGACEVNSLVEGGGSCKKSMPLLFKSYNGRVKLKDFFSAFGAEGGFLGNFCVAVRANPPDDHFHSAFGTEFRRTNKGIATRALRLAFFLKLLGLCP